MEVKLTAQQVAVLRDVTRAIAELQQRRVAMLDMVWAGAGLDPTPARIQEREDGVYLVAEGQRVDGEA